MVNMDSQYVFIKWLIPNRGFYNNEPATSQSSLPLHWQTLPSVGASALQKTEVKWCESQPHKPVPK